MKPIFGILIFVVFIVSGVKGDDAVAWVDEVRGEAFSLRNFKKTPLVKGQELKPVDYINTGEKSMAQIRLKDQSILSLGEKSCLKLSHFFKAPKEQNKEVELLGGLLRAKVTLQGGNTFSVRTPEAVAGVRGTDFQVSHSRTMFGIGATVVSVLQGKVQVQPASTPKMERQNVTPTPVIVQKMQQSSVQAGAEAPSLPQNLSVHELRQIVAETPIVATAPAPAPAVKAAATEAPSATQPAAEQPAVAKSVPEATQSATTTVPDSAQPAAGSDAISPWDAEILREAEAPAPAAAPTPDGGAILSAPGTGAKSGAAFQEADGITPDAGGVIPADGGVVMPAINPADGVMRAVKEATQQQIQHSQQVIQERTREVIHETIKAEVRRNRIEIMPQAPPPNKE